MQDLVATAAEAHGLATPSTHPRQPRARIGWALMAIGAFALTGARSAPLSTPEHAPTATVCGDAAIAGRPALYSIPLLPDQGLSGSGVATLVPAPSPFGITVTADGHPIFDVTVTVQDLAPAASGAQYVAWATTQDLTTADRIGVIGKDQKAAGKISWNKYIVLVTQEATPAGEHWKGPVVLRGFSPATYLANYASHPLFVGGMPPC